MKVKLRTSAILLATTAVLAIANTTQAQAVDPEADVLREVVVTATRRAESVLKVPLSIVALGPESIEKSNITDITKLAAVVPGIEFNSGGLSVLGPRTQTNISIRGVSDTVGPSTVGIYIDESGIQGSSATYSLFGNPFPAIFDIERVEVLRGPQGTLFGSGAMGGAIRFIQTSPGLADFSGRATAQIGVVEGGAPFYEAGGAFGGPLVKDTLGFRASAWHRRDGGYVDHIDPFNGRTIEKNADFSETTSSRLALTWAPAEDVTITPSVYYQKQQTNHTNSFYAHISDIHKQQLRNDNLIRTPSTDRFVLGSIVGEFKLGGADLTSVSSYFDRNGDFLGDSTVGLGASFGGYGNPKGPGFPSSYADLAVQSTNVTRRMYAQELRLSSVDSAAPFRWTVGGFYSDSKQIDSGSLHGDTITAFNEDLRETLLKEEQLAAFVQADYEIVHGLRVAVGGRYSRYTISGSTFLLGSAVAPDGYVYQTSFKNSASTPKFSLDYEIGDNVLVYATAEKGVRPGGLNPPINEGACGFRAPVGFGPDSVWSYEVGTKSLLFANRATFTASAYYVDWQEIQQSLVFDCFESYVANSGSARIKGFDVTFGMDVMPSLRADLAVTHIDATFASDVFAGSTVVARKGFALGSRTQAPAPWSITASLEYSFALGAHAAYARAESIHKTKNKGPWLEEIPGSPSYDPTGGPDPTTHMLNLSTGVTLGEVDLTVFVENALNELPLLAYSTWGTDHTWIQYNTFRPRTVGLSVNYRF